MILRNQVKETKTPRVLTYTYLNKLKKSFTEGSLIKIFGSVTLKNSTILRATNEFHGRP
ncbi:hypothetical protein Glove_52g121 [Diversispora epigaea]|uniref:Uncharacterized protein n=1 Tax=Diversispora epigaea TaxID=1348612 RepID=A0A397JHN5_9GLOM|nr:hypothetical protein Glove_52g121 [Diversispora epigaea]